MKPPDGWVAALDAIDAKVAGAFSGKDNLHDSATQLDALAEHYERLRPR